MFQLQPNVWVEGGQVSRRGGKKGSRKENSSREKGQHVCYSLDRFLSPNKSNVDLDPHCVVLGLVGGVWVMAVVDPL